MWEAKRGRVGRSFPTMPVAGLPARGSVTAASWWENAACAEFDPEWWADDRSMRPIAVGVCLSCPVKKRCLDDALKLGDYGVVRGGMFLAGSRHNSWPVSLVCPRCGLRAVRVTATGHGPYCVDCTRSVSFGDNTNGCGQ
jgi:hypothetical protein